MSSTIDVFIDDENKPANIPKYEMIMTQSFDLRPRQITAINTSGVRITLDKRSENEVSDIWVKFGRDITMGEAETQRFVAQDLENNNIAVVRAPRVYLAFTWCGFGFIVTEYINGQMCGDSDIPLVAAAVQHLITIRSPSPTPGPVGGGLIEHPFFIERTSSIQYESVEELEAHINGVSVPLCFALSFSHLGCSPDDDSEHRFYARRGGASALASSLSSPVTACVSASLT
jgi:hypothetical protein